MRIETFGFEMGNVNGNGRGNRLCWKSVENGLIVLKIGWSHRKWVGNVRNGLFMSKMGQNGQCEWQVVGLVA